MAALAVVAAAAGTDWTLYSAAELQNAETFELAPGLRLPVRGRLHDNAAGLEVDALGADPTATSTADEAALRGAHKQAFNLGEVVSVLSKSRGLAEEPLRCLLKTLAKLATKDPKGGLFADCGVVRVWHGEPGPSRHDQRVFVDRVTVLCLVFSHVTDGATKTQVVSSLHHSAPAAAPAPAAAAAAAAAGEAPGPPPGERETVAVIAARLSAEGDSAEGIATLFGQLYNALGPAARHAVMGRMAAVQQQMGGRPNKAFTELSDREKSARITEGWNFTTRLGGGVATLEKFVSAMMREAPERKGAKHGRRQPSF